MADEIHLVRDLLDKQLVDANRTHMGKVDGVVLQPRKTGPPRVTGVEVGAAVLADRLHPGFGRRVRRLLRRLDPRAGEAVRIPLEKILHGGLDVQMDLDARRTSIFAVERWLARHLIGRIPGAGD